MKLKGVPGGGVVPPCAGGGICAHQINHGPCGLGVLAWQTGYGVVSFGQRDLPWVVD